MLLHISLTFMLLVRTHWNPCSISCSQLWTLIELLSREAVSNSNFNASLLLRLYFFFFCKYIIFALRFNNPWVWLRIANSLFSLLICLFVISSWQIYNVCLYIYTYACCFSTKKKTKKEKENHAKHKFCLICVNVNLNVFIFECR